MVTKSKESAMENKPNMARGMKNFIEATERYMKATQALTQAVARQNQQLGEVLGATTRIVKAANGGIK